MSLLQTLQGRIQGNWIGWLVTPLLKMQKPKKMKIKIKQIENVTVQMKRLSGQLTHCYFYFVALHVE